MKFKDKEHKDFYFMQIARTHSSKDPFRKALFYTLGLTGETREHINDLYDFKENCIDFEGLKKPWQTGGTGKVTRLAFNLYNGYCGEADEKDCPSRYTPYNLFDCEFLPYMLEAVKVLLEAYAKEIEEGGNKHESVLSVRGMVL